MEWISVEDRLPEVDRYVLIKAPSGYTGLPYRYSEAKYNPDYKGWTDVANDRITDSGEDVTHWMPLPEPPTEQEKSE